jgi:Zn-dependent peptidase ImmA (M78 family)
VNFNLVEQRDLRAHFKPAASSLPVLNGADYKDSATQTRAALGVPAGESIDRFVFRLERCGVSCLALSCGDTPGFDAFSTFVGSTPVMLLNFERATDRVRLTAAHEVDHLVRRRSVHSDLKRIEGEAWGAGAELLMPEPQMRIELRPATLTRLAELKQRWGVSMAALARRPKDLGLISASQYSYLNIKRRKFGWWEKEPGIERVPPEKPRAIRGMFELIYGDNLGKLAAGVGFPVWLVQAIVGAHAKQATAAGDSVPEAKLISFPTSRIQPIAGEGPRSKSSE